MGSDHGADSGVYRLLQKHLDRQPVGFPSTRSGADIKFLKRMFTEEEAVIALHLSFRPFPIADILADSPDEYTEETAKCLLESMLMKGSIGFKKVDNVDHWFLMPMVIGMFEAQDGNPSPGFLKDAGEYMRTIQYGKSLIAARPSQMRTIPINASIEPGHSVATYDQVFTLIESSDGPFAVLPCICRESKALQGQSCKVTSRKETCLGMGAMAAMVLHRGHGREVTREEAIEILQQNQDDGLVLQPGNAQSPEFVCSCCGCCCGMLGVHKMLPHPVDFWTSSYQAVIDSETCTGCGICVKRCQVEAVSLKGSKRKAVINRSRCIGCGLCVPTCPVKAIGLIKKEKVEVPPADFDELNETILANRKGSIGKFLMFLKVILKMRQ
jgi:Na+-translocating ferredoxin:NAD+ oxidoreductase subunit B